MNNTNNLTLQLTYSDKHYTNTNYGFPYNEGNCTTYAYDSALYLLDSEKIHLFNRDGWFGNAKTWYDEYKYEKGQVAKIGAIICWSVSDSGNQNGHVGVVTNIYPNGNIDFVEGYSGCRFNKYTNYDYHRSNVKGFMYLPNYNPQPTPPTPTTEFNIGDRVLLNGNLYPNKNATNPTGYAINKETTITRKVNGLHPFNTTGDLGWCDASSLKKI